MAKAMASVVNGGTGGAGKPQDGTPYIGKTGTTDGENHVWFAAASTKLATAIWTGNVVGTTSMRYTTIQTPSGAIKGDQLRFKAFKDYMTRADAVYGGDAFPEPSGTVVNAPQAAIPDVKGKSMAEAQQLVEAAGFTFQQAAQAVDNDAPAGTAAGTDPAAGTSATKGSAVTVFPSNGMQKPVPDVTGQPLGAAANALRQAGWTNAPGTAVQVTDANCDSSKVFATSPAAGTPANPANTPITFIICKKP
jgi:membrane peptidoglycan carboxypeptidase